MPDGGKVSLDVVPSFGSFGSLFAGGIRGALSTAQREGGRIGSLLGGGLRAGVVAGTLAAGIAIGDFVASGMRHFLQLTDQARSLERVTGGGAQQVSLFAGVIRKMGGDVEAANRPLGIFGNNIATQPQLFQKYGVEIARFKNGTTDILGTLDNLRKKNLEVASADERLAMNKALLSRGYQTLLPYLSLTNDRLAIYQRLARQGGEVFSQKDIDQARDFKVQVQEMKDSVERLKLSAGKKGVALGSEILQGLDVYSKISGKDILKSFTSLDPLAFARPAIKEQQAQEGVQQALAETEVQAQETADAQARLATEEDKVSAAAEGLRSAEQGQASAHRATEQAVRGVASAHHATEEAVHGLSEAQYSLNQLYGRSEQVQRAVTAAEHGVEQAHRATRDATESLTDATRTLTEAQQFEAQDAASELTDLHLSLAGATLSLAEARRAAATARPTISDPFAQQRARLSVQQAVQGQKKAQEDLTKAQQFGTQADRSLTDAQRSVRDASERLTEAFRGEDDAQVQLREAQRGVAEYQHQIAEGKRAVNEASRAVAEAEHGEADAAQALNDARQSEEDATLRVRDAQYKLDDAVKATGSDQAQVLDVLAQKYPELAGIVEQSVNRINAAVGSIVHIPDPTGQGLPGAYYDPKTGHLIPEGPMGTPVSPGRARGGPVIPGRTYRINEERDETVTFPANGVVNAHPANLTPVGGDGGSIDYEAFGAAIAAALIASGRPLVTVGEQVVLAQKRYGTATHGRR